MNSSSQNLENRQTVCSGDTLALTHTFSALQARISHQKCAHVRWHNVQTVITGRTGIATHRVRKSSSNSHPAHSTCTLSTANCRGPSTARSTGNGVRSRLPLSAITFGQRRPLRMTGTWRPYVQRVIDSIINTAYLLYDHSAVLTGLLLRSPVNREAIAIEH
jgi:hypothetical protein